MRLHHIALAARDVAGLAAFYARHFGLPEIVRHHDSAGGLRSIWLDLAGTVLMIEAVPGAAPPSGQTGGVFLLAFAVSPAERVRLAANLAAAGVAEESRTAYTSYFRDPEGNRVAVSHYPEAG